METHIARIISPILWMPSIVVDNTPHEISTRFSFVVFSVIWYHSIYTCPEELLHRASEATQGLYSLSGKKSYRKISWSLEAARFRFKLFQSLWNLAGTSAALLPRCLSNFRATRPLQHPISRLRDFTRFSGKTSYRLVNRGPEECDNFNLETAMIKQRENKTQQFLRHTVHGVQHIYRRLL